MKTKNLMLLILSVWLPISVHAVDMITFTWKGSTKEKKLQVNAEKLFTANWENGDKQRYSHVNENICKTTYGEDKEDTATIPFAVSFLDSESIYFSDSINIYPNPAKDYVIIDGLSGNTTITICNLSGKTIQSHNTTDEDIVIPIDFASGLYLVKINATGTETTKRLIVVE